MTKSSVITGVVLSETTTFSAVEVCERFHIPNELLLEMIEQGLFHQQPSEAKQLALNLHDLQRIETAIRLHRDLEVNLPGVALALDLLDELQQLRKELAVLRRQF